MTCPWRSFYEPIVVEVMDVMTLCERGLGMAAMGADPPAILVDACAAFERSRAVTRGHWMEQERLERERNR